MAEKRPRESERPLSVAPAPSDFTIVGVGASAGGFDAFTQFLEGLPPIPNVAVILVQHLAPHHSSSLASLLSSHTSLPVVEATEGARIMPNRVYVVPPNVQMKLADGRLRLEHRPEDRSQYNPIDFRHGEVRRHAARGDHHPDGRHRRVPAEIGAKVAVLSRRPYLAPSLAPDRERTVSDAQMQRIFRLLLTACGVNFAHYKRPTIIRRLFRRMALLRMVDVDAYLAHLEQTPLELVNLHNDLLIHVTRFFREAESFDIIARDILPSFDLTSSAPLRMWSSSTWTARFNESCCRCSTTR